MAAKKMHDLHQVYVTNIKTGAMYPHPNFPKADKEACNMWATVIAEQIRLGRIKDYRDPQVVQYLAPSENQLIGV